jgi:type I restriction enzyme R subunit
MNEKLSLSIDVSEKHFESDIEKAFLKEGYAKIDRSSYDSTAMLFPDAFIKFVSESQPKEWARYTKYYGEHASEKLIRRFNDSVSQRGLLDVLKKGIDDMGIKLQVCYFKPDSELNVNLVELYQKNIISVTRQFPYSTKNTNTIDMVLSLNGIPVFAFELKNQFKGQDYQCAIQQWKEDRDYREPIFRFGQRFFAYFAVDLYEVWMTTQLKGEATHFIPFNQGSCGAGNPGGAGNPANPEGYVTSYLWEKVFSKDSLMDLIHRFVTVVEEKNETTANGVTKTAVTQKLIFPRYHQYDVVHKILDDVEANGSGKNYLIEHSAGSGKSNSIAWIAYRLAAAFDKNENPIFDSVIVVTNRIVLDSQLQDTINSFDHKAGLVECITQKKGSRGLTDAINDRRKIIICTVQKFLYGYKDFDKLDGRNFAIIIDEAHQGQSGESARTLRKSLIGKEAELKKYAEENGIDVDDIDMDDELVEEILGQGHHDNQSFFAFTATPTEKTLTLFGTPTATGRKPFHTYSMRQAIEEGFILDVLKDYTTIQEAFHLLKNTEDNPELLEERTKRALFKYYKSHDFTVSQKVDIIMDSFLHNGRKKIDGHGKAMVVTDSRHSAVKFYFAIKDYIKAHPEECAGCGALVAFSGDVKFDNDPKTYREAEMNVDHEGHYINSDKKFRKAFKTDEFNIMVVADKYQTGYDEPLLHSMYVDKKLQGVNAVQTLSRLNRTCPGKTDTFVLDFANTKEDIKSAFQPYYEEASLVGEIDLNAVYDLRSKVSDLGLYTSGDVDTFSQLMAEQGGKKTQDAKTIGKIASLLKPVIDRYKDLEEDKQHEGRENMLKFVRAYGFVTQVVRINDEELFKDYVFVSNLIHLLPRSKVDIIDLTGKVTLQYATLKETFHGTIDLEKEPGEFQPKKSKPAINVVKKTDTLERIVQEVNEEYDGDFGPGDKVALDSVFKMLMDDPEVKKHLADYARNNDIQMFIQSIFPKEFQRVLGECVKMNDDAFQRLLGNAMFQQTVMNIMAKELYKTLSLPEDKKGEK